MLVSWDIEYVNVKKFLTLFVEGSLLLAAYLLAILNSDF